MTSEASTEKRKGGWPKGRSRKPSSAQARPDWSADAVSPLLSQMKARPNWENDEFRGVGLDGEDRLHIPPEMVQALHRDGIALQWITKSVRGQEAKQEVTKMTRGGWTPVHQSDFGGVLDGRFHPKGADEYVVVDDCMLVARPVGLHEKARAHERKEANAPVVSTEEQLGYGLPHVSPSAARHPTVRNFVNKSMERVTIPE